jgi:hypothetical protein
MCLPTEPKDYANVKAVLSAFKASKENPADLSKTETTVLLSSDIECEAHLDKTAAYNRSGLVCAIDRSLFTGLTTV